MTGEKDPGSPSINRITESGIGQHAKLCGSYIHPVQKRRDVALKKKWDEPPGHFAAYDLRRWRASGLSTHDLIRSSLGAGLSLRRMLGMMTPKKLGVNRADPA